MPVRISDTTVFDNAVRNIQRNRVRLAELQQQVGSGKRIQSLADDPGDAARVLSMRRTIARLDQYQRNIDAARGVLEPTESALASATDVLARLRELAVSADIETAEFDMIQAEVEALYEEMVRLGNSHAGDRYLFGGFATSAAPFVQAGVFDPNADAPPPSINYGGDAGLQQIDIGEASRIDANVPGSAVFLGDDDGDGTFPDAGRVDVFEVIQDFRNALRNQDTTAILGAIGDLDLAIDQVVQTRGKIGARLNRLEMADSQLEGFKLTLTAQRSNLEDVDVVEAITALRNQENTLQASLGVTARVLPPSLMDFLS